MTDLDQVIETIRRNVPVLVTRENTVYHSDGTQTKRDTVTMFKPLQPWGHTRFHKALALHIHQATRPAGHGSEMPNFGIMDSEADASVWDRSME